MSLGAAVLPGRPGETEYVEAFEEELLRQSELLGRAMSYRAFTLEEVKQRFSLHVEERPDVFATIETRPVSALLQETLRDNLTVAVPSASEKARSELLLSPVLMEVRRQLDCKVSLHSGKLFEVDEEQGLVGHPDFVMSRSPEQIVIEAPVIVVVEVKKDKFEEGFPQCLAGMVGAQLFNHRAGTNVGAIFGAVTTGHIWQFMSLTETKATIDLTAYYINEVERIVGILVHMLSSDT